MGSVGAVARALGVNNSKVRKLFYVGGRGGRTAAAVVVYMWLMMFQPRAMFAVVRRSTNIQPATGLITFVLLFSLASNGGMIGRVNATPGVRHPRGERGGRLDSEGGGGRGVQQHAHARVFQQCRLQAGDACTYA